MTRYGWIKNQEALKRGHGSKRTTETGEHNMITIYGIQGHHVARLRSALLQKGLDFEHVSVNLAKKSAEFQKLSPAETIPVLQDGDMILTESIDAIHYLDEQYPKTPKMLGSSWQEKSKILNLIWAVDKISSYLGPLYIEKFNLADGMKQAGATHRAIMYNQEQKTDLQKEVSYRLVKLAKLKEGKFFTSKFSSADASMLGLLQTLQWLGMDVGEWAAWKEELMKDQNISNMFAPQNEKGVREI